jgi:hypothetical protein
MVAGPLDNEGIAARPDRPARHYSCEHSTLREHPLPISSHIWRASDEYQIPLYIERHRHEPKRRHRLRLPRRPSEQHPHVPGKLFDMGPMKRHIGGGHAEVGYQTVCDVAELSASNPWTRPSSWDLRMRRNKHDDTRTPAGRTVVSVRIAHESKNTIDASQCRGRRRPGRRKPVRISPKEHNDARNIEKRAELDVQGAHRSSDDSDTPHGKPDVASQVCKSASDGDTRRTPQGRRDVRTLGSRQFLWPLGRAT